MLKLPQSAAPVQVATRWLRAQLFRTRTAEAGEVLLTRQRVFIVPTRTGLIYGVMLVVLFLCSINYSLSLGFALTFLLAACAVVDMVLTWRNLVQLVLSAGRTQAVFAGEVTQFPLHLHNRRQQDRHAIHIGFADDDLPELEQTADVSGHAATTVMLGLQTQARGWLAAPRIRLRSSFPLGLFHAWSYWQPDARVLVYPMPEAGEPPLPLDTGGSEAGQGMAGNDDFAGIRAWQAGDSMRHMAWRQIARNADGALVTKQFEGGTTGRLVLDYAQLPEHLDTEQKLSRMTRWVLMAESLGAPYGFILGNMRLPADTGPGHLAACLQALALYGHHA